MEGKKIRVVLAKPGIEGHDIGVMMVARALRAAGMEVVYLGLFQTPEQIVRAAIQEDADVIGLSILCGGHRKIVSRLMDLIRKNNLNEVKVMIGGVTPKRIVPELKEMGVWEVFFGGTSFEDIINRLKEALK